LDTGILKMVCFFGGKKLDFGKLAIIASLRGGGGEVVNIGSRIKWIKGFRGFICGALS
jgi:hypothetical protein